MFSAEWRREVFKRNIQQIESSDVVIAIYDDEDPGTMMEVGYAYARGIPVILIVFVTQPINLMLAQSSHQVISISDLFYTQLNDIQCIQYIPYTGPVK